MSNPTESNGAPDLAAECKKWEARCAELTQERDRLNAELTKVKSERAADLKAIYALTQKDFEFTEEEIFAQVAKGPPLDQIIANLGQPAEKSA